MTETLRISNEEDAADVALTMAQITYHELQPATQYMIAGFIYEQLMEELKKLRER